MQILLSLTQSQSRLRSGSSIESRKKQLRVGVGKQSHLPIFLAGSRRLVVAYTTWWEVPYFTATERCRGYHHRPSRLRHSERLFNVRSDSSYGSVQDQYQIHSASHFRISYVSFVSSLCRDRNALRKQIWQQLRAVGRHSGDDGRKWMCDWIPTQQQSTCTRKCASSLSLPA